LPLKLRERSARFVIGCFITIPHPTLFYPVSISQQRHAPAREFDDVMACSNESADVDLATTAATLFDGQGRRTQAAGAPAAVIAAGDPRAPS
jgi:hypothetical protein